LESPWVGVSCWVGVSRCAAVATAAAKLNITSSAFRHKKDSNGAASTACWQAIDAAFILAE